MELCPDELIADILYNIKLRQLIRCKLVCKKFNKIINLSWFKKKYYPTHCKISYNFHNCSPIQYKLARIINENKDNFIINIGMITDCHIVIPYVKVIYDNYYSIRIYHNKYMQSFLNNNLATSNIVFE